jgi:hypothetical protein
MAAPMPVIHLWRIYSAIQPYRGDSWSDIVRWASRARPQGEIFSMILEIGQGYILSPENDTPNSLYTAEYLHKIYGVEKIS